MFPTSNRGKLLALGGWMARERGNTMSDVFRGKVWCKNAKNQQAPHSHKIIVDPFNYAIHNIAILFCEQI